MVRCGDVYVDAYRAVARSDASIPEKLEAVVGIFEDSLKMGKICTVGMLSVESVTLNEDASSFRVTDSTLNIPTVQIFPILSESSKIPTTASSFSGIDASLRATAR